MDEKIEKIGTWKSACLDLTSGFLGLHGTGKHVVKSDWVKPTPFSLGAF